MDVVWWVAAEHPILTIKDVKILGDVREVLGANEGVIGGIMFNKLLRGPYAKGERGTTKNELEELAKKG